MSRCTERSYVRVQQIRQTLVTAVTIAVSCNRDDGTNNTFQYSYGATREIYSEIPSLG